MINFILKKIKFTKSRIIGILVIILSLITAFAAVYKWFEGGTILYYWDTLLPFSNEYARAFLSSWNSFIYPGIGGAGLSWIEYIFSVSLLERLFSSLSVAQGMLYVLFILLSIITFYILSNYLLETIVKPDRERNVYKIISFLFAIFYSLNLFTFYYSYFLFNPQAFILSVLPINILSLFKLFPLNEVPVKDNFFPKDKKSLLAANRKKILWVLVFFLSGLFMTSGFTTYIFLAQYFILILFYLMLHLFFARKRLFSRYTLTIVLFFLMVILMHWWWFFPSLLAFKDLYQSQSSLGTAIYFDAGSIKSNLLNSLRLFGSPMMNNNPFSWDGFYTDNRWFSLPLFLFPFLILYALLKVKKSRNTGIIFYFLTVLLASLFIVKLGNPPLAWITKFFFEHVPFFGAFRDAWHKAGLFYIFAYFPLSFIGFAFLTKVLIEKKQYFILKISLFILLLTGVVVTGPFFLFSYDNIKKINFTYQDKQYTFSAKTKIPPEYYELKSYLLGKCDGTTILGIPKNSMISSAIWQKYGTSYVGQDILTHFIPCNFISTQLLNNGPDSFIFSPYMLLEKGDFLGFKNFLLQNQIGFVLIRKDNIPYGYTNYVYLSNASPALAMGFLDKDNDFKKTFENDFFTLYLVKRPEVNYNYGFSLPTSIVYTNSSLNSGRDYVSLSKQLSDKREYLIINKNDDFKKYKSLVSLYAPVANCVGCVKISSYDINPPDESFLRKLKDLIKQLIGRNSIDYLSQDKKISYALIESSKEFSKMMRALAQKDFGESKNYISSYIKKLENIESLFKNYKASFFDLNNKNTEIKIFLGAQNETLSRYLNSGAVMKNDQIRGQLYLLLSFQNFKLAEIEKNIWETDFKNKIYRMRLDIPKEGKYDCAVDNYNNGLKINNLTLESVKNYKNSTISAFLYKGSYPVSINYSTDNIISISSLKQKSGEVKEVSLGNIPNGFYKVSFSPTSLSKQKIALVITKNKLNLKILESFGSSDIPQNDFIFIDTGSFFSDKNYEKYFSISSFDKQNYYLYLFSLNPQSREEDELEYKDIFIERAVEGGDIQFFCKLESPNLSLTPAIKVIKESAVKYRVIIPEGQNIGKFLVFNQSYGSNWEAFEYKYGKKRIFPHINSGYANAWFIDSHESAEINVVFNQQGLIIKNFFITIILFAIALFLFLKYKNR